MSRYRAQFALSFASVNLGANTAGILLAAHWLACVWGWVGKNAGASVERSWIGAYLSDDAADDRAYFNARLPRHQCARARAPRAPRRARARSRSRRARDGRG